MPYCYACRNDKPVTHGHFVTYGAIALRPPKRPISVLRATWARLSPAEQARSIAEGRDILARASRPDARPDARPALRPMRQEPRDTSPWVRLDSLSTTPSPARGAQAEGDYTDYDDDDELYDGDDAGDASTDDTNYANYGDEIEGDEIEGDEIEGDEQSGWALAGKIIGGVLLGGAVLAYGVWEASHRLASAPHIAPLSSGQPAMPAMPVTPAPAGPAPDVGEGEGEKQPRQFGASGPVTFPRAPEIYTSRLSGPGSPGGVPGVPGAS